MAKTPDVIGTLSFAVIVAGFISIAVTVVGCDGSGAKHFGSDDAGLSTGSGGGLTPADTGGASASGGATGSGGTTASGGTIGSGGRPATGGEGGSGGVLAAGGAPGTGGAGTGGHGSGGAGTGGSGTGGRGTGGAASGGSGTGGAGTGGKGTGGASTGGSGTGGSGTGGAGTGGSGTGGAGTGGAGTGGAGTGGNGTGGAGTGTGGAGTGGAGTGGSGTGGANVPRCHLLVNEIQTGTALADSDEFVELYNSCPDTLDLSGYSLNYRSAGNNSGAADITLYVFPAESRLGSGGFVVIAGTRFPGGAGGRFTNGGLAAGGGAVAVRNATGTVVDSVAYETLTAANNFTEGFPCPNPPLTSSIIRVPAGTDTDNNSHDFQISLVATPGAANL